MQSIIEISSDEGSSDDWRVDVLGGRGHGSEHAAKESTGSSSPLSGLLKKHPNTQQEHEIQTQSPSQSQSQPQTWSQAESQLQTQSRSPNQSCDVICISSEDEIESPKNSSSPLKSNIHAKMPDFVTISEDTIDESDFSFTKSQPVAPVAPAARARQMAPKVLKKPAKRASAPVSSPVKRPRLNSSAAAGVDLSSYNPKQLNEANKVKRTRPELMSEMIIYLPSALYNSVEIHSETPIFEEAKVRKSSGNDVSWQRCVSADYHKESDIFLPCEEKEIDEHSRAKYYDAETFVRDLMAGRIVASKGTIILVDKLPQHLLKLTNLENKIYKDKVLGRATDQQLDYTAKEVDHKVNELEYVHGVNVFPVRSTQEALEWLVSFTYTLGFARYDRAERLVQYSNITSMKGNTYKETFVEMISKFRLMPVSKCERLFVYYDSLYKIYQQLVMKGTLGKDDYDRRLVPETSENAMKIVFTSENPHQVIYE